MILKAKYILTLIFINTLGVYLISGHKIKRAISYNNQVVTNPQVIVIGGGVSGLAACSQLISNGIKNILVLEANDRLGGRINTIDFQNKKIEIGAQWIHGQVGNPVFNIMNSLNQIDPTKTFPDSTFYYSTQDGVSLSESYVDNLMKKFENSYNNLEYKITAANPSLTDNAGSFLDRDFNSILKGLTNPDADLVKAIYAVKLNDKRSDYAIDSFYDLSAQGFNEYVEYSGEEFTNLKNGYKKLIDYLSANISLASIKLNEEVKSIDYSNSNGPIKIITYNKAERVNKIYNGDIVLSTVSLGYLKANYLNLFTPSLPSAKISAIQKIGYGTVDKIFLVFDSPVFKNGEAGLQIFWKGDISYLDYKYNLNGNKFYKGLNSFYLVPNSPNILFAFLVGNDANYAENLSDSVLLNIICDILANAYPKLNLPRPSQILRSKWNNDPYAKGSYSFYKVGSSYDDVIALAKPVNNRLFFAGEATSPQYMSSVHGGYISGVNAATKIISVIKS